SFRTHFRTQFRGVLVPVSGDVFGPRAHPSRDALAGEERSEDRGRSEESGRKRAGHQQHVARDETAVPTTGCVAYPPGWRDAEKAQAVEEVVVAIGDGG